jgi:hypothetical protein
LGRVTSQTPAIIGAAVCVLIIIVAVVMSGGDDETAAPAPPPAAAPGPAPVSTPGPPPSCDPSCENGGTCTADGTCACTGDIDGTGPLSSVWLTGATWEGPSCADRPACSLCGTTSPPYCGLEAGCDPTSPPQPVVATLSFGSSIEAADIAPGSEARAAFENAFAADVSAALNIPAENIVVISIDGGSILVEFAILPDANFQQVDGSDGQYAFVPEEKLAELATKAAEPGLFAGLAEVADIGEVVSVPAAVAAPDNTGEPTTTTLLGLLFARAPSAVPRALWPDIACLSLAQ